MTAEAEPQTRECSLHFAVALPIKYVKAAPK